MWLLTRKTKIMRLKTLALAVAIAASGPVLAKRVNITAFSPASTDVRITFSGGDALRSLQASASRPGNGTYEVEAGQLSGFLDGESFLTFCTEALATVAFGDPNTPFSGPEYALLPAPPEFGAKRTGDISRLFTAAYASVVDVSSAAAFQAAVWEIIYETKPPAGTFPSYNLTDGSFLGEAVNGADAAAFNNINGVLASLGDYGRSYRVEVLVNESFQDYLSITQVPEPGTYALLAAGLGVIGFVARRRQSGRG